MGLWQSRSVAPGCAGSDVAVSTGERLASIADEFRPVLGRILAGSAFVRIRRGALAGAIAGLIGAYAMEGFQAL